MSFVHLHVHTEYSLLDGSNKIKEYVNQIKALGMNAGAITDHGNMYGVIEFYKAAHEAGIRPVIGCEVYVAPHSRFDKEATGGEERYNHLILLAENNTGYHNLMKIVSIGFTEGFYYRPRVDREVLEQYHEGLICLSACVAGEIPRMIQRGQLAEAREAALWYRDLFGEGNYYLELQDHGLPVQRQVNVELMKISKETGIPLVVTNDVHYTYESDVESHDILLCIQTGKHLSDTDRLRYEGGQFYLKSEEEMAALFPYAKEALENTQRIADRCDVTIDFGDYKLPHYEVPEGYDSWTYLNKLCDDGLKERYGEKSKEDPEHYSEEVIRRQLDYELGVIRQMGFVDYFLIVWDFINYAKTNGIAVGPGRGSAAGAIVSYLLRITNIDPIRYSLFFERFLNPERVSMPDIDIDFEPERRQEVVDYVRRKYGEEKVVQIITFGTLKARGVIRDVGRVMEVPYAKCDQIAKMVPPVLDITLKKAMEMNPDLKLLYDTDEEAKRILDMSMRLEGLPRQSGIHAAGVVICPEKADEYIPLSRAVDGSITTEYEKTTVEKLGLLKMDFLGLRNLTVIQDAIDNVEKTHGFRIDIDAIDYDDKKVYAYIGQGKGEGIFQLESSGMESFMKRLKPDSIEDVIAGISLYRPGPMDSIPRYIEAKNNPETVSYACPELEPILRTTYGCIVYQEQVMQIVRELAGYTMGRSDTVRSAMSKKKFEIMEYERGIFIDGNEKEIEEAKKKNTPEDKLPKYVPGCVKNGIPRETAEAIYESMIEFARYAFNKSHAACYAVVAYQTAYLKYYYPAEFMAALLNSVQDDLGKIGIYSAAARQMGIEILPPDINVGDVGFTVLNGAISYALASIRNVGSGAIRAMVEERKLRGIYRSLQDFIERTAEIDGINKKSLENLIKAGAFDCFGATRKQMLLVYLKIADAVQNNRKNTMAGQMSLLDLVGEEEKNILSIRYPANVGEYPREVCLSFEKEVLGIYVSGHPLESYAGLWDKVITKHAADLALKNEGDESAPGGELLGIELVNAEDNEQCRLGGIVTTIKVTTTKKGDTMAFLTLEDMTGQAEVIVFPKTYQKYRSILVEDAKLVISGRISTEEEKGGKLITDEIVPFDRIPRTLWLQFADAAERAEKWDGVNAILEASDGNDGVKIYESDSGKVEALPPNRNVEISEALLESLKKVIPQENIRVTWRWK